jgi:NAD(P)H-dependent FMN reductase
MRDSILIFYGSYRADRQGIRLAHYLRGAFNQRGADAELIDAKAIGLPMLDRMYKEYPPGKAPSALEGLAGKIRRADAFVFVTGEYNWGVQPGLKNLTDHFLEEWFWRPAAIASYSAGRFAGARAGGVGHALDPDGKPTGDGGAALDHAFPRFADDLAWWTQAARVQRASAAPPY